MSDWKQEFADTWNPLGAQVRKNKEAAAAQAATAAGRGQTARDAAVNRGQPRTTSIPTSTAGHNPAKIKDAKLAAALSKPTDRTGRK